MTVTPATFCVPNAPVVPPVTGRKNPEPVTLSALCSMGWRPLLITGLLRDVIVRHFASPRNIEESDLKQLVWQEDTSTGILVESIHRWRGELVEKRPAVIIKRNAQQNVRIGISDSLGADEQGNRVYQTFWAGSHSLFCIHGSGAGAELLATEVQREITQFSNPIVTYLGLHRLQVTEVGAVAEVEEARESFVVPITVGWYYSERWVVEYEARTLRRVPLSILLWEVLCR